VTITYDEALRERVLSHLAGHERRTVTDPTKRHAAVAVVLVDSEAGEDRVDPAPVWSSRHFAAPLRRRHKPTRRQLMK